jgi:hypothetical protein
VYETGVGCVVARVGLIYFARCVRILLSMAFHESFQIKQRDHLRVVVSLTLVRSGTYNRLCNINNFTALRIKRFCVIILIPLTLNIK